MLSTITAAETQFRHEDGQRRKEIALLASIRERRAAASRADRVTTIAPGGAAHHGAEPRGLDRSGSRTRRLRPASPELDAASA